MIAAFWFLFGAGLSALAVAAGITLRSRRLQRYGRARPVIDDRAVEAIIEEGRVWVEDDDPLDLREIGEQEDRFWSERWDEPTGEW